MKVTGIVEFIDPARKPSKGKDFTVRSIGLDTSFEVNETVITQKAVLQFQNDHCKKLDPINIGDKVEIDFNVAATIKKKEGMVPTEKNPEGLTGISNLNGFKIAVIEAAKPNGAAANPPAATNTTTDPAVEIDPSTGQPKKKLPF